MKLIFSFLIIFYLLTSKVSADVSDKISVKVNDYFSNLVPGEGITEVSIDLRENNSPDFSILAVRELEKSKSGNFFTQFSFFSTEQNNDERIVGNLGFGKRNLSKDKLTLTGTNLFFDYDSHGNMRTSLGLEARNAVLEFYGNYYKGLDEGDDEKVLDGYDLRFESQVPYLHWADIFYNTYKWKGVERQDIEGAKMGSEIQLTSNVNLEIAYDDKKKKGIEDEWYARIMFIHPPKEGPSAKDGIAKTAWKEEKDMTGELLTKVKRNNKIMIEFKGSATISRTD
tara:strand:- start:308 stop:1156 length:849 start_codon:yes stop_codon:yes gene_type:complete